MKENTITIIFSISATLIIAFLFMLIPIGSHDYYPDDIFFMYKIAYSLMAGGSISFPLMILFEAYREDLKFEKW